MNNDQYQRVIKLIEKLDDVDSETFLVVSTYIDDTDDHLSWQVVIGDFFPEYMGYRDDVLEQELKWILSKLYIYRSSTEERRKATDEFFGKLKYIVNYIDACEG